MAATSALVRVMTPGFGHNKAPVNGRLRVGDAATDPVADEQAALTSTNSPPISAQDYETAGDGAADDQTAVGYYQNAAGIAANAALSAVTLAPNDQQAQAFMQASRTAAGEALNAPVDFPVGTRQAAQGFALAAIQAAQQAINRVRQVAGGAPAPNPPPTPGGGGSTSPATTTTLPTWAKVAIGAVVVAGVGVAGYYGYQHFYGGKEGAKENPTSKRDEQENGNGLTYKRWLAATGANTRGFPRGWYSFSNSQVKSLHAAWKRGEDPSDYRADR